MAEKSGAVLDAREDFAQRVQGKRFCYWVSEVPDQDGNFRPCAVIEGEPYNYPMDYTWGKDYKLAKRCERAKNHTMGITPFETLRIVASSMGVKKGERDGRTGR